MSLSGWSERTLGSCAKFISGGTPDKSRPEFWNGDIPWVSSGEMGELFISDTSLKISFEAARAYSKLIPAKTVLVVVRGMSLAKQFRVAITKVQVAFNQDLKALICVDDVDPEFLFYALRVRSGYIRDRATEASHGTKKLESEVLLGITLKVPNLAVQKRVVEAIRAYDELIQNNRRRIGSLEQAARLLYREWFLYFRFPGHEHVKLANGFPASWEPRTIKEMTDFLGRGISPSYDEEADFLVVNQKCIRDRMMSMAPARKQKKEFPSAKALRFLDVLINSTGTGTLGRVAQCWFAPTGVTFDSHVTVARPNGSVDPYWFGYALLALESVFEGMGEGATNQKELAKSRIAAVIISSPPLSLQRDFGLFAADSCRQIQVLAEQNEKLIAARNLLLPRLMSGEIAV